MSTQATKNFIGVYGAILESYSKSPIEMLDRLVSLDDIAEKSLTFTEYSDFYKTTQKMFKENKNAKTR